MREERRNILLLGAVLAGCIGLNRLLQDPAAAAGLLAGAAGLVKPFLVGGALAFVLNLPMRAIERRMPARWGRARRKLALGLTVWLVLGVLAAVVLLLVPTLRQTVDSLAEALPAAWARAQDWLAGLEARFPLLADLWPQVQSIQGQDLAESLRQLLAWMGRRGGALVGSAAGAAGSLLSGAADTV
ncbi:MAG: AI-2E family transporter, partial [Oscillospiraceae bacterium]|nr:AI-2E family transporter [Oscillospiraceae bacterium]